MKKSLLALILAGITTGCLELSPEGLSFGRGLFYHAAQEAISNELNPRQTNVYVPANSQQSDVQSNSQPGWIQGDSQQSYVPRNNQQSGVQSNSQQIGQKEYWIDENMLDGSEKDKEEAREVYFALLMDNFLARKAKGNKEDYVESLRNMKLNKCPKRFADAYRLHAKAWERYIQGETTNPKEINDTWDVILKTALQEGVREK